MQEINTCVRMLMTGELVLLWVRPSMWARSAVIEKPFDANTLVETVGGAQSSRNRLASMLQNQRTEGRPRRRHPVLHGSGLQLAIQPIVRTSTNAIFGYEMLLRSSHPTLTVPVGAGRRRAPRDGGVGIGGCRPIRRVADGCRTRRGFLASIPKNSSTRPPSAPE